MAGAGRKSAYRKSVTEEVLNSFPEPDVAAGQRIVQVTQSRGGNILQVCVYVCVWKFDDEGSNSFPSSIVSPPPC